MKDYLVKCWGFHEKYTTWLAAKDIVYAKELVDNFEISRASDSNKISLGIIEDINLLKEGRNTCITFSCQQCP